MPGNLNSHTQRTPNRLNWVQSSLGTARDAGTTGTGGAIGAAGAAGATSLGFMRVLVGTLTQPMLSFSKMQRKVIILCGLSALDSYADHLPGCTGFNSKDIDRAVADLQGRPYVWATEFENVHTTWEFSEPEITVQGNTYSCTKLSYHAQKPDPFDEREWWTCRVAAMREGLRKFFFKASKTKTFWTCSCLRIHTR